MHNNSHPPIPGLLAEGGGRRAYRMGPHVVLQDVCEAWWAVCRPRIASDGKEAVSVAFLLKHPELAATIGDMPVLATKKGSVDLLEVIDAVTSGDRADPPVRVPTVEEMERAVRRRNPNPAFPDDESQEQVLLANVASSLACMGGRATGNMLRHDLLRRLGSEERVKRALKVALRTRRIECERACGTETFSMHTNWDAPQVPPVGAPNGWTVVSPESAGSIFDE